MVLMRGTFSQCLFPAKDYNVLVLPKSFDTPFLSLYKFLQGRGNPLFVNYLLVSAPCISLEARKRKQEAPKSGKLCLPSILKIYEQMLKNLYIII